MKGDGERQSCVEGFYFGKAVQKNIQPNVAVKRETQILSVKKKNLDQPTSSEEGRGPRPGGVLAGQADSWPPAGKAVSLSALQRKTGHSQGWSGSGSGRPLLYCCRPPRRPWGAAPNLLALPGVSYRSLRVEGGGRWWRSQGCVQGWLLIRA